MRKLFHKVPINLRWISILPFIGKKVRVTAILKIRAFNDFLIVHMALKDNLSYYAIAKIEIAEMLWQCWEKFSAYVTEVFTEFILTLN